MQVWIFCQTINLVFHQLTQLLAPSAVTRDAKLAMTALSAHKCPLGAARSILLLAFVLLTLVTGSYAQVNQATAVPPAYAVQPLYGESLLFNNKLPYCHAAACTSGSA